ncbi:MAG: AAA family ATPase [Myxococcaceae bacterium]|nr:AAA family ATPase [Myxococcaceae bacterium]
MRYAIGIDDFQQLRTSLDDTGTPLFYCDKSLFIRDVIRDGSSVLLLPRPRRFGKSLNLSMLKYFMGSDEPLFEGLAIEQYPEILAGWRGKFPVVTLGFKGLKADTFGDLQASLKGLIASCFRDYEYLTESVQLSDLSKKSILPYFSRDFPTIDLGPSLMHLTKLLEKHHGQKVWVLIDEYDTPLQHAYLNGFFPEAVALFKQVLGAVLKSNTSLYKAVITGITRISKESLFSDLNNIRVYDITQNAYANYFGFTEEEVEAVCPSEHLSELKSWYNGYSFGKNRLTIYNPWSVLNFLSNDFDLKPYWVNTSGNDLIQDCLTADKLPDVRKLIQGESIDIPIEPHTVMSDLRENAYSFWNLLFVSGYLTLDAEGKMMIPNREVAYFFEKMVTSWFGGKQRDLFLVYLLNDLIQGNAINLQKRLQQLILESMSFYDVSETNQESFYHGFLLGITLGLRGRYTVKSNRESGYGRYDLGLYPLNAQKDPGILIEVKMGLEASAGLEQVEEKAYYQDLQTAGCSKIQTYSIAFDGKHVSSQYRAFICEQQTF